LETIHVYGDSKTIIDGIQDYSSYDPPKLQGWMEHIKTLIRSFKLFHIHHFYKEANINADTLSKVGLNDDDIVIRFCYFLDGAICEKGFIDLP